MALPVSPPVSDSGIGSLAGYLVGVGEQGEQSSWSSDDSGPEQVTDSSTLYTVSIAWGEPKPTKTSDLLITDTSRVVLLGREVVGDAAAKERAIERALGSSSDPPVARVTYRQDPEGRMNESIEPTAPWQTVEQLTVGR